MTTVPDDSHAAADFLGLQPTDDPLRWRLPVTLDVAGATGTLHGGCAIGAAVAALELSTERPLAAATSQYLARAPVGEEVEVVLDIYAQGKAMTQAGFTITVGDRVVLRGQASLGGRDLGVDRTWAVMPDAPPPEDCQPRAMTSITHHSFTDSSDLRLAGQTPGHEQVLYWARVGDGLSGTSPILAALADVLPSGMRVSLDAGFRGSSLDNTVRIGARHPAEWVLLDLRATAIHNSIGHGVARIFAQDGTFLASGSQSFAITEITGDLDR